MKQERFDEIKEKYGNLDFVQELIQNCYEFKEIQTMQSVDCMKLLIEIEELKKKSNQDQLLIETILNNSLVTTMQIKEHFKEFGREWVYHEI